jgi:D-alanyl-D-alanine carboxypeptidase
VVRGGNHVIGVVMGGRTALRRDLEMVRILDDAFTQIAANPALVATRTIPWHQFGGEAPPVVASLSVAPSTAPAQPLQAYTPARSRNPFSNLTAMVSPSFGARHEDDEDAAEKKVAADEDASIMAPVARPAITPAVAPSPTATPAPNAVKPVAKAAPSPTVRPRPRPEYSPQVAVVARAMPAAAQRACRPKVRMSSGMVVAAFMA